MQAANACTNVALRHGDGLAIVERLNGSQKVQVLLEKVGEVMEQLPSRLWGCGFPLALESFARRGHSDVDILLCRLVDRTDDGLV